MPRWQPYYSDKPAVTFARCACLEPSTAWKRTERNPDGQICCGRTKRCCMGDLSLLSPSGAPHHRPGSGQKWALGERGKPLAEKCLSGQTGRKCLISMSEKGLNLHDAIVCWSFASRFVGVPVLPLMQVYIEQALVYNPC